MGNLWVRKTEGYHYFPVGIGKTTTIVRGDIDLSLMLSQICPSLGD